MVPFSNGVLLLNGDTLLSTFPLLRRGFVQVVIVETLLVTKDGVDEKTEDEHSSDEPEFESEIHTALLPRGSDLQLLNLGLGGFGVLLRMVGVTWRIVVWLPGNVAFRLCRPLFREYTWRTSAHHLVSSRHVPLTNVTPSGEVTAKLYGCPVMSSAAATSRTRVMSILA